MPTRFLVKIKLRMIQDFSIPLSNPRNAVYRLGQSQDYHFDAYLKGDFLHPNDAGHRVSSGLRACAFGHGEAQHFAVACVCACVRVRVRALFVYEPMSSSDITPGPPPPQIIADVVIHLIQEVALGLVTWPLTFADEAAALRKMPDPMYPGEAPRLAQALGADCDMTWS